MDDAEFTRRLAGCENALKRFVYYKMPNKSDGDDVLQETLLAAYLRSGDLKNPDGFKAWILRIAANKCNDFYRRRGGRRESLIYSDAVLENALSQSQHGLTVAETVQDTMSRLSAKDAEILQLFYIWRLPQAQIAKMLKIPSGTVKSRLHTAKRHFKLAYPYLPATNPNSRGEKKMQKLPKKIPDYTIVKSEEAPFHIKWEEMMGWFIVPRLGQKLAWAIYDWPEKTRSYVYETEVAGKASVHGIDGVEITAREYSSEQYEGTQESHGTTRTFVAQLTDTHCRFLSECHHEGDVKRLYTFLDGDEFLRNWGFGEDNCGKEVNLKLKGTVKRDGSRIETTEQPFLLDIVGRYLVTICGKKYDCVCVIDVETHNDGVLSEQFIDANGRTVLWRRYNRDDWKLDVYKQPWSKKFPANETLSVNGKTYVHWYDCITDYIL